MKTPSVCVKYFSSRNLRAKIEGLKFGLVELRSIYYRKSLSTLVWIFHFVIANIGRSLLHCHWRHLERIFRQLQIKERTINYNKNNVFIYPNRLLFYESSVDVYISKGKLSVSRITPALTDWLVFDNMTVLLKVRAAIKRRVEVSKPWLRNSWQCFPQLPIMVPNIS